jgi:hypothetical protein
MLMDMCSKVFSPVMTARAFALINKHGTRFQLGGTPEIGCRDGLFTLNSLLNARHNHDLASYVGFVDLVKAYDTVNHALLIDILRKYGVPPKFTAAVETIYRNNTCVLKIENGIREIPQMVGVRQGDNMAPVLFLFLMTAFAKTLELVWKERDIPILRVMTTANEHIAEGKICSHTPTMFKSKKLTAYEILQCLYGTTAPFHSGRGRTCNAGWNSSFTTLQDSGWKCTLDAAPQSRRQNASSSPPLTSSSAWRKPTSRPAQSNERSGGHNEHTPCHALWRNMLPRTRYPPYQSYHCLNRP